MTLISRASSSRGNGSIGVIPCFSASVRVGVADPHDVVLLGDPVCAQGYMPVRRAEDDRLGLVLAGP
jgi:hypothetical protein